ncbi:glycoside hydrolase family 92 protein [Aureibaculum algae]|uniref:Glycoside hydrolase family 92 protein n=1 Tax=Aureibaculum algae TaxID=2584122 RepID=A0A5B7TQL4_9FLAO|nr:GH92 family glycosyl hydrolase [Aureibaculum algae]QCX37436.1 glycoside hydrolase family 92 protein [Aureibaculum algae]
MKNTRYAILLVVISILFIGCKEEDKKKSKIDKKTINLTSYVNPFHGTAPLTSPEHIGYNPPKDWRVWAGLTFPGSSLPNAMVQVSPITEYGSGAGYEYEDTEILGFTHTNKGHWNLCNIPILPLSKNAQYPFKSKFSHDKEKASPAYYEVVLEDYNIKTRLTSTLRAAIHEYTFEDTDGKRILFDLGKANNKVDNWDISHTGKNTIEGFQKMGKETIYFSVNLSTDIDLLEIVKKGKREGYAILNLTDTNEQVIILKIGISFVNSKNAAENMNNEIGTKTFDITHIEGESIWNTFLSQIEVSGGSDKEIELFYSTLYRSVLWPALRSDINGEFIDVTGKTRKENFNYYTIPSLWDTYRNKLVLLALLQPEVTNDVIKTLMDIGELTGYVPTFFHGDHGASFITGSYFRGINDFDVNKAYKLLLQNAYKESENRDGRVWLKEYIEKGYIPESKVENPIVETVDAAGVSKTLEYAYDDYALSLLAKELKDTIRYNDLTKRSKNYKNVFDISTNFMRGRLEDGAWVTPFDPQYPYYEYMYREANAWQVSFYVPHDMIGLVELYGGKEKFEQKLDSFFTLPWNPEHIARNVSSFIGQYCHGNQPDHEAPFSYYFIDKPEKSQIIIDRILKDFYGVGEHGLAYSGMDDAGEMSSWYVCAAMGLYPLSPADSNYLVSVPIFEKIKWNLKNGKNIIIQNPNKGRKLKSIEVNGEKINSYFVDHLIFKDGGIINIETE